MTYAAVVLPVPVSRSYIYEVPETLTARVVPGARVVVPLRRRSVVGIVTAAVSHLASADMAIKPIIAAPDDEPAISPPLLELGRWMSDYYGAPLGLALRAILPGPLWSVARRRMRLKIKRLKKCIAPRTSSTIPTLTDNASMPSCGVLRV